MTQTITLHPSRIGCPSIPATMKGIIMSVQGVKQVKVRYEDRSVDVTFDNATITIEQIVKKVGEEMGMALEPGDGASSKSGNVAETCPM